MAVDFQQQAGFPTTLNLPAKVTVVRNQPSLINGSKSGQSQCLALVLASGGHSGGTLLEHKKRSMISNTSSAIQTLWMTFTGQSLAYGAGQALLVLGFGLTGDA